MRGNGHDPESRIAGGGSGTRGQAVDRLGDHGDEMELLDAKQISELFHIPVSWIQRATQDRGVGPAHAKQHMPHIKLGHYTRFQESAVREWLQSYKKWYPKPKR